MVLDVLVEITKCKISFILLLIKFEKCSHIKNLNSKYKDIIKENDLNKDLN